MMQGQNNNDDDILSYMEICDFDLASSSNSLAMDLNLPDFGLFNEPPQNDFAFQNLNLNNPIHQNNQIPNHFASFEAMNPNPNPNPNPNTNPNPNPNLNPNFNPPLHSFFRTENAQTGQNPTRLSLIQNSQFHPPIFHNNNNTNNNNPSFINNNNNNNIASSSRGETDISRAASRKRPDATPAQQNRAPGITINNGPNNPSRYSGISNSSASESVQGGNIGAGFVRNTRMRIDPVHGGPSPFAFNPSNLPQYNIPNPLPNPNSNPNPNPPMMAIPALRQNNPNPNPNSVPPFQAVPMQRAAQNTSVPVMVPPHRLMTNDQFTRAFLARTQTQTQSQQGGLQAVQIGTGQVRNINNNVNNNNVINGFPGFNIGSRTGSESQSQRPQFRRFVPTLNRQVRTNGTAGGTVPVQPVQNLSRRREQTQFMLDAFRQENRRRLARHMLGILRPGQNISLEDIILFEQTVSFGDAAPDRHRDMRLDVDNMSYEELLALEERIGNVSTGLSEETIMKRLKQKLYINSLSVSNEGTEPCCICQEEYEEGDKVGKLECGHDFHTACIKQWLVQKNVCPICKKPGLNA